MKIYKVIGLLIFFCNMYPTLEGLIDNKAYENKGVWLYT